MPFDFLYIALVWIGGSILCAFLAKDKGRNGGAWLLLALFASPVLALLGLAAASDMRRRPS